MILHVIKVCGPDLDLSPLIDAGVYQGSYYDTQEPVEQQPNWEADQQALFVWGNGSLRTISIGLLLHLK